MIKFILNDKDVSTDLPAGMVMLDFIRYQQNLKGTKIGCREGDCGACTILVGELMEGEVRYRTFTSCLMPIGNAVGKHIVSIEGINLDGLNPIQQAMADEGATQCGFCTPGFVMSLAGHCLSEKEPTAQDVLASIDGNICRCTGYKSIERAALLVNELLSAKGSKRNVDFVTENNILPDYFAAIPKRLKTLNESEANQHIFKSNNQQINFASGGTDLYVQKHDSMTHAEINFLSDQKFLKGIEKVGNRCMLGGSTTVTDLCESAIITEYFPAFKKYAKLISSTPIRNMATLAGNFVNASPIGDFTVFFLSLNACLILSDGDIKRELPLREFYKGYKSLNKKVTEYIEKIYFELPDKDSKFNFEKVSKRTHLDIASVNSAITIRVKGKEISEVFISAGGVGPIPMMLAKASAFLAGKQISPEVINQAIHIAQTEISPISDARGSESYKRLLLSQLIKAHFIELFPEIKLETTLV
ncbi:MAG: 2Fe-2S iron-sulfur cluster-binding protein [Bacteroidota bacterium]